MACKPPLTFFGLGMGLLAGWLTAVTNVDAQAKPAVPTSLTFRGGIVAPAAGRAFVVNPKSGIDAIDLKTGATLWTVGDAKVLYWPLVIHEGNLIARRTPPRKDGKANAIQIVALAITQNGKVVFESEPMETPGRWKIPPLDPKALPNPGGPIVLSNDPGWTGLDWGSDSNIGAGDATTLDVRTSESIEAGKLHIRWQGRYEQAVALGIPPGRAVTGNFAGNARIEVDLQTGRMIFSDETQEVPRPAWHTRMSLPDSDLVVEQEVTTKSGGTSTITTTARKIRAIERDSNKTLWERPLKGWTETRSLILPPSFPGGGGTGPRVGPPSPGR